MSVALIRVINPQLADPAVDATPGSPTHVELSVVVPAYREGKRIFANITRLIGELDKLGVPYEVVVVSDGNTDATVSEAKRIESRAVRVCNYAMMMGKDIALRIMVDQSTTDV